MLWDGATEIMNHDGQPGKRRAGRVAGGASYFKNDASTFTWGTVKHCFCSLNDWELYFFKIVFKKSLSLQKTWIKSHASVRLHHTRRQLGCTGGTLKTEAKKKRERRQATTLHDFHKILSAQVFFFSHPQ